MANLQKEFEKFHLAIKVEKEELREKRDIIINKIKGSLKSKNRPIPELLNQGSYIYGVGVKPKPNGEEYDIDVGLVFNISSDDYKAHNVRRWVFEAIKDHTEKVEEKGPCIRVHYQAGYHVDLICYASNDSSESERFKLAHKNGSWIASDPKALKKYIKNLREPFKSSNDDSGSDQFQRVVRYLKRWNDEMIPNECNDKPFGLALVLLCGQYLKNPEYDFDGTCNDLKSLSRVCTSVSGITRISAKKPTQEYEDVFKKISTEGMKKLISRFTDLKDALDKAAKEDNSEKACKILREKLGKDFPLSEGNKGSGDKHKRTSSPAIITSSSSA